MIVQYIIGALFFPALVFICFLQSKAIEKYFSTLRSSYPFGNKILVLMVNGKRIWSLLGIAVFLSYINFTISLCLPQVLLKSWTVYSTLLVFIMKP